MLPAVCQHPCASLSPPLLQGAWVALLECDYVWMKPLPSPGDAFTSNAPGWQYHFGEGLPLGGDGF